MALKYSYEFSFEKAYLKQTFTSYYIPKMIAHKIKPNKITEVLNLVCNTCSFESIDDNFLRPEVLQSLCETTHLSSSIFYDEYYSFIYSDYSTKILQWRHISKISQKKAAKLLKISPVDIGNWERHISYPSRHQYKKLQEVIK